MHIESDTVETGIQIWRKRLLCVSILLVVSLALNWEEYQRPASIGLRSTKFATVPLFNAWTIGWNANRLQNGLSEYWDAPIFAPHRLAFAFSEPQPATWLVAPIVWTTGSIFVAYKVYLTLSLFLNGWFTYLLLARLGHAWWLQLSGAIGMMLLPIVHQRIDIIQLVPVWGMLWFWLGLLLIKDKQNIWTTCHLAAAFVMCFALCIHHALFLCLTMLFAAWVFLPDLRKPRFATCSLSALLISLYFIYPIAHPLKTASERYSFKRSDKLVTQLSARPQDYLNTQENAFIKIPHWQGLKNRQFGVGWFRTGLALLGLSYCLLKQQRRQWGSFMLATLLAAVTLSFGPRYDLFGFNLWNVLAENIPGVSQVRSVYRFVWIYQLATMLLAIEGLAVLARWTASTKRAVFKAPLFVLLAVSAGIYMFEMVPQPKQWAGLPKVHEHLDWINYVKERIPTDSTIACLPFSSGKKVQDYDITTRWMCYGLYHKHRIVNGYSGFFPQDYIQLRKQFKVAGPTKAAMSELLRRDVRYLVVSNNYSTAEAIQRCLPVNTELRLLFTGNSEISVYEIE